MKENFKRYIKPDIVNAKILVDAAINNLANLLETDEQEEVTFPEFIDRNYIINILKERKWKVLLSDVYFGFEDNDFYGEYYFNNNSLIKCK